MSERYSRLYTSPENLYTENSPVIFVAGAILRDNVQGNVLAQLKFKNISSKTIKSLSIEIVPFDTANRPLGNNLNYSYLDLSAEYYSDFGEMTAIPLENPNTRAFKVNLVEVIFDDNSIYTYDSVGLEPIPKADRINDARLNEQFIKKYGAKARVIPLKFKDIWLCSCGHINKNADANCNSCSMEFFDFTDSDLEELIKAKEAKIEEERIAQLEADRIAEENRKRQEEERKIQEEKAKVARELAKKAQQKLNKIIFILAIVVVVIIGFAVAWMNYISPKLQCNEATSLMENHQYEEAIATLELLPDFNEAVELLPEVKYQYAIYLYENEDYIEAENLFSSNYDYKESSQFLEKMNQISSVYSSYFNTVILFKSGKVITLGKDTSDQCNTSSWSDIVDIAISNNYILGLKGDGTIVSTNEQDDLEQLEGAISIDADNHIVGLYPDGTVSAIGNNNYGECDISDWNNIISVEAGLNFTVGLKDDGTVLFTGKNNNQVSQTVSSWTDIISISVSSNNIIGLTSNGTVMATGDNTYGQCNTEDWSDIIAISSGATHTVGLKSDGSVVAIGCNYDGQCNVSSWNNVISISAGYRHTIGQSSYNILATGSNNFGQCDVDGINFYSN